MLGSKIGEKCAGRGECHIHNVIELPADFKQARALTKDIAIGKGRGKYKGTYDLEKLTGLRIPPLCSVVCPEGLKNKCDTECIDWAKEKTIPPVDGVSFAKMKQKLSQYDHDAECACDAGNIMGTACQVLCPSKDGNICNARGPELPSAAPGMKKDSWAGELIFRYGSYHAAKGGCLWGLHDAAGLIENWRKPVPDRFDRDRFVKGWFQDGDDRGAAQDKKQPGGVSAKKAKQMDHSFGAFGALFADLYKKHYGISLPGVYEQPRMPGVLASCRCWHEMGFHKKGDQYTCIVRCKGAGWAESGENVCGGKYKFTNQEPTYGLKSLWGLKKDPQANLYPASAEHPNKDFHDKIVKNQEQPRGKCWVGIHTFEKWGVDVDPALGMCESASGPSPPSPINPHPLS